MRNATAIDNPASKAASVANRMLKEKVRQLERERSRLRAENASLKARVALLEGDRDRATTWEIVAERFANEGNA